MSSSTASVESWALLYCAVCSLICKLFAEFRDIFRSAIAGGAGGDMMETTPTGGASNKFSSCCSIGSGFFFSTVGVEDVSFVPPGILSTRVRNSNSRKRAMTLSRLNWPARHASRSSLTGASKTIVARYLLWRAWSPISRSKRCSFGVKSSMWARTPSRSPYSVSNLQAVFSPIPGTPGILSDLSPTRPLKSGSLLGGRP